jgi:hypothetical protein
VGLGGRTVKRWCGYVGGEGSEERATERTPRFGTPTGEDTDSTEYEIHDREKTTDQEWIANGPPLRSYLSQMGSEMPVIPPIPDPLSFASVAQTVGQLLLVSTPSSE